MSFPKMSGFGWERPQQKLSHSLTFLPNDNLSELPLKTKEQANTGYLYSYIRSSILPLTTVILCLFVLNSLTPKSVPAGTKLVLFGRYVLNIYVGIV